MNYTGLFYITSRWRWWMVPMPFSVVIFIYDETRKYWMRHRPGGWLENETYY